MQFAKEDEVEVIDAWEPGEDFDLMQLAERDILLLYRKNTSRRTK